MIASPGGGKTAYFLYEAAGGDGFTGHIAVIHSM